MIAKRYLLKAEYLSNFKSREKKGGPPKLKVTTKKTVQSSCYRRNYFHSLLVGLMGAIRAITLSNKSGNTSTSSKSKRLKQKAQHFGH